MWFPLLKFFFCLFPGLSSKTTRTLSYQCVCSWPCFLTPNTAWKTAGSGMRKLEGNVRSCHKHRLSSWVLWTVLTVTSAFKLLLTLIYSLLISFSVSLGCCFYHFIITFIWKKVHFHFKGNCQQIQDLMGKKCWDSALPISCSFRVRTGKQR